MNIDLKQISGTLGIDSYDIRAVYFPVLCNMLFVIIVCWSFLKSYAIKLSELDWNNTIIRIMGIIIFLLITLLISRLSRYFSKQIIEKLYYGSKLYKFPTIRYLSPKSTEKSDAYRKRIVDKIEKDFLIKLPSNINSSKARINFYLQANDAIGLIRKQVRDSSFNSMYIRKNIRYGACRNFIGGSIVVIIPEFICLVSEIEATYLTLPIVAFSLHIIVVLTSCIMLPNLGKEYATELYDNYLNINK
ncbi:MAG: hypothetical protein KAZ28_00085 [Bacteroidaceae bacterium]|nr:hypothetical protein [Bacteroidaceae bacterium]